MKFRCVDLETTDMPSEDEDAPPAGIMEIGWCDLTSGEPIGKPTSALVDSGIPVAIKARAVHHISDAMVAGEINSTDACIMLAAGDHAYVVAHNTDFEKKFIGAGVMADVKDDGGEPVARQWLCTYKTSLRLWPEAPGHKLQELRYFLDLDSAVDFDEKLADPPHRAGADAYVCAHLLRRLLHEAAQQDTSVDRLVKWSSGPALLFMCYLKKHKGTPWSKVPDDYLRWIVESSGMKDRDILATARYYLKLHTGK